MQKSFFVYILASKIGGTLYVGLTSDLPGRIYTHREDLVEGFSRRYGVHRLVWFEQHGSAESAIRREKQIKKWNRAWKVRMIEETNPTWSDLYPSLFPAAPPPPMPSFPRRRESSTRGAGDVS